MPDKGAFAEKQIRRPLIQFYGLTRNKIRTIECEQASAAIRKQWNDRAKWISRLQIQDRRNTPSVDQPPKTSTLRLEGQEVYTTEDKSLTRIKVGTCPLGAEI